MLNHALAEQVIGGGCRQWVIQISQSQCAAYQKIEPTVFIHNLVTPPISLFQDHHAQHKGYRCVGGSHAVRVEYLVGLFVYAF